MKKLIYVFRFSGVGLLNYVFGNGVFTVLWLLFSDVLSYTIIAFFVVVIASTFSFFTHQNFTFKNPKTATKRKFGLYFAFQVAIFLLSIITIPKISEIFKINLLLLQYLWSASASIIGVLLISRENPK